MVTAAFLCLLLLGSIGFPVDGHSDPWSTAIRGAFDGPSASSLHNGDFVAPEPRRVELPFERHPSYVSGLSGCDSSPSSPAGEAAVPVAYEPPSFVSHPRLRLRRFSLPRTLSDGRVLYTWLQTPLYPQVRF